MRALVLGLALAGLLTGVTLAPPAKAASADGAYADPADWLCRPGRADACSAPLTAVAISNGQVTSRRTLPVDADAPVDCFYVYPTVSHEPAANADRTAGPEEVRVAQSQFAPFAAHCRLYAPLYRQTTMTALEGQVQGADPELAYADVLAAWTWYLAHDNHGRGVVLIGHSQGAKLLVRLLAEAVDGRPEQQRLVAAYILGAAVGVAPDGGVGGRFQHIPLCVRADQAGCVIAYSSYLAAEPPDASARFGGDPAPGQVDACVSPADLLGHDALASELPAIGSMRAALNADFVENPNLIHGHCQRQDGRSFLAISLGPGGELLQGLLSGLQSRAPGWGLHLLDVNLTQGDLIELVDRQSKAWAAHPQP